MWLDLPVEDHLALGLDPCGRGRPRSPPGLDADNNAAAGFASARGDAAQREGMDGKGQGTWEIFGTSSHPNITSFRVHVGNI